MALDFTSIATGLFSTQAAGTALPKLETQLPSLQGLGNLVELDTAGGHLDIRKGWVVCPLGRRRASHL